MTIFYTTLPSAWTVTSTSAKLTTDTCRCGGHLFKNRYYDNLQAEEDYIYFWAHCDSRTPTLNWTWFKVPEIFPLFWDNKVYSESNPFRNWVSHRLHKQWQQKVNSLHTFCKKSIKLKKFQQNISAIAVMSSYYLFNCRNYNVWENMEPIQCIV